MQKIKYFVTSHTAHGFVNFLPSNIKGLELYLLEHPSLSFKTKVFEEVLEELEGKVDHVEVLISGHSRDYIDGLIIPPIKVAIVSDHILSESSKQDLSHIFKNNRAVDAKAFEKEEKEIEILFSKAHQYLRDSLTAHEKIEAFYIEAMDFNLSNEKIKEIKELLFKEGQGASKDQPGVYQRLFGSHTVDGDYHIHEELLSLVERRILLQGGPGTGKSFFMREFVKTSLERGYAVEKYMCSFDPKSIDMVTIPELKVSILDSTGSHAFSAQSDLDLVIDLFQVSGRLDIESKYRQAIEEIRQEQRKARRQASKLLKDAGKRLKALEVKRLELPGVDTRPLMELVLKEG